MRRKPSIVRGVCWYDGYLINNSVGKGSRKRIMDRVIALLKLHHYDYKAASPWFVQHARMVLNEGCNISTVIERLSENCSNKWAYLWVVENSEEGDGEHYHVMAISNKKERDEGWLFSLLSRWKGPLELGSIISHFHIPPVEPSRAGAFMEEYPEYSPSIYRSSGLLLKEEMDLRYAVYWFTYLAKIATKETVKGRGFASSQVASIAKTMERKRERYLLQKKNKPPYHP